MRVFFLDIFHPRFVKAEASESMTIKDQLVSDSGRNFFVHSTLHKSAGNYCPLAYHLGCSVLLLFFFLMDFNLSIVSISQLELACFLQNDYTFSFSATGKAVGCWGGTK